MGSGAQGWKKGTRVVERQALVAGDVVTYGVAGAGEPAILVHGLSGSARWWAHTLPALARHYQVYLVDLPGFGGVGHLRSRFVLAEAAAWLRAWMHAVGLEAAHLVGHSMGGSILLQLAAEQPDAVRRLVLVAPVGVPRHRSRLAHALPLALALRQASPRLLSVLLYDAARAGPRTLWRVAGEVVARDVREILPLVTAPTLLIWGARDPLVPAVAGDVLRRGLAGSRLLVLEGAGHVPMFDRPHAFNAAVLAFLAGAPVGAPAGDTPLG